MTPLVFILFILTSTVLANLNLLNEIQMGQWILVAGGSNAPDAPPPSKSCVRVTVTDTGKVAECVFNNHNYTNHNTRIIQLLGYNDNNQREIYSVAPIHQWLDTENAYHWNFPEPAPKPENISFNSLAKSTICWNPVTHVFNSYTFTITALSLDQMLRSPTLSSVYDYLYLVGVNTAMPGSELHVGLLVKEKVSKYEVERMIEKIESLFTKNNEFPKLIVKCASDYRM